jgi:hypothetical protein
VGPDDLPLRRRQTPPGVIGAPPSFYSSRCTSATITTSRKITTSTGAMDVLYHGGINISRPAREKTRVAKA